MTEGKTMVRAVMAFQLLSGGVQFVEGLEGNLYGDNGASDEFTWLLVFGAIGVMSAFWLLKASVPSRVVALVWHVTVIWWMLNNIQSEKITGAPLLMALLGISVISAIYLAVTSLTGIARASR
jgi:hypothetical protein